MAICANNATFQPGTLLQGLPNTSISIYRLNGCMPNRVRCTLGLATRIVSLKRRTLFGATMVYPSGRSLLVNFEIFRLANVYRATTATLKGVSKILSGPASVVIMFLNCRDIQRLNPRIRTHLGFLGSAIDVEGNDAYQHSVTAGSHRPEHSGSSSR